MTIAYKSLLALILVIYIAPMNYIPVLRPLRLAFTLAAFTAVAYIFSAMSTGKRIVAWNSEVKLVVSLLALGAISISYSIWPGGSYETLVDVLGKSVIVFLLICSLLIDDRRMRGFLWVLTSAAIFNAAIGINNYRTDSFMGGGRIQGAYSGLTSNPNDLAISLALILPFAWLLAQTAKTVWGKTIASIAVILTIVCVIVTFSRGGFIVLFIVAITYSCFRGGTFSARALVKALPVGLVIMLFVPAGYYERLLSSVDFSLDATGSATARWELTKAGFTAAIKNPFGVGLGMNELLNHDSGLGWHVVHNVYLQIATEIGLVGAVLFIRLLYLLLVKMWGQLAHGNQHRRLLSSAVLSSLVGFSVAGFFAPIAYHFYFYILAGMAVAINEMSRTTIAESSHVIQAKGMMHVLQRGTA